MSSGREVCVSIFVAKFYISFLQNRSNSQSLSNFETTTTTRASTARKQACQFELKLQEMQIQKKISSKTFFHCKWERVKCEKNENEEKISASMNLINFWKKTSDLPTRHKFYNRRLDRCLLHVLLTSGVSVCFWSMKVKSKSASQVFIFH